jgi:hypothetical protein
MNLANSLRAYLDPSWRAQEWLFWTTLVPSASTLPVTFNGQSPFPNGCRGIVAAAEQVVARTDSMGQRGIGDDLTNLFRFTLKLNDVVVPGFNARPSTWRCSQWQNDDSATTATGVDGWQILGTTDTLSIEFPLLVPINLKSGDRLTWTQAGAGGPNVMLGFRAQGWFWPAANEDERAKGSAADPWL